MPVSTGTSIVRCEIQKGAAEWPVGTPVFLVNDFGRVERTRTRSRPFALGDGTPVVAVDGRSGGYALDRMTKDETALSAPVTLTPGQHIAAALGLTGELAEALGELVETWPNRTAAGNRRWTELRVGSQGQTHFYVMETIGIRDEEIIRIENGAALVEIERVTHRETRHTEPAAMLAAMRACRERVKGGAV